MAFYGSRRQANDSPEWTSRDRRGCALVLLGIAALFVLIMYLIK